MIGGAVRAAVSAPTVTNGLVDSVIGNRYSVQNIKKNGRAASGVQRFQS